MYPTMLKKKQRLTKKEFDQYFQSGKRFHDPLLQLIYTPHASFQGAVVVGKKVHKKAVDRNRLRRRLYAALYTLYKEKQLTGVYIIIAKPVAKNASHKELKELLSKLIKTM